MGRRHDRPTGRVSNCSNPRGSNRVGSGGARNLTHRVRSCQVRRVASLAGWIGSPGLDPTRKKGSAQHGLFIGLHFFFLTLVSFFVLGRELN